MNLTFENPTIDSFQDFAIWMNTLTNDLFWTLISVFLFAYIFLNANKKLSSYSSIAISGFINFILSVLLKSMFLISDWLVILYAVITGIGIFMNLRGG